MNAKDIIRMLPKDYRKHTSRDLTVFTSSIFGETYVETFKRLFNIDFPSVLWVVREGNFTTLYRSENDHQNFRKLIGEKFRDRTFASHCIKKLREYTDWFNGFTSKDYSLEDFSRRKDEFVDNYREFFAYHQAVYWGADYLLENYPELKDIITLLQDVYAYNELVIPNVEQYLLALNVGHLDYKSVEGEFQEVGLLFFSDSENVNLYDTELKEIESFIIGLNNFVGDINELKGITVSKGVVVGKVQVIKDPNRLHEMNTDNILVTGMTRPQFNHVLSKCKGVIANDGNILSHAAILAREFNLPCVVGTKVATEVLRDGDLVELDATNGIVRLLERRMKPN
jgi:phosphohistidine swiveling domain-containing protein